MKTGDLRRFRDDAFVAKEKHLNGAVFMIVELTPDNGVLSERRATILVDGTLDDDWYYYVIENHSEVISEAR
jgi:hypothetical protein